jgi:hypothetical protein
VPPPGEAQVAALVLANLIERIGAPSIGRTWVEIFKHMTAEFSELGVTQISQLGDTGRLLGAKRESQAAALGAAGSAAE